MIGNAPSFCFSALSDAEQSRFGLEMLWMQGRQVPVTPVAFGRRMQQS
jgi:hypothetical protein